MVETVCIDEIDDNVAGDDQELMSIKWQGWISIIFIIFTCFLLI